MRAYSTLGGIPALSHHAAALSQLRCCELRRRRGVWHTPLQSAHNHSFCVHKVPPFAHCRSRLPLCPENCIGCRKNHIGHRKNYIRHNPDYIRPFFAAFKSQKHKSLQRIFSVRLLFCEPALCAIWALLHPFRQLSAPVRCRSRAVVDCTAVGAYGIRPELRRFRRRLAAFPPVLRRVFRGSCAAVWRAYAMCPYNSRFIISACVSKSANPCIAIIACVSTPANSRISCCFGAHNAHCFIILVLRPHAWGLYTEIPHTPLPRCVWCVPLLCLSL